MSWLRSSPLRQSFTRRTQEISTSSTDSRAVIDSFCKHWEQIIELIGRSEVSIKNNDQTVVVKYISISYVLSHWARQVHLLLHSPTTLTLWVSVLFGFMWLAVIRKYYSIITIKTLNNFLLKLSSLSIFSHRNSVAEWK